MINRDRLWRRLMELGTIGRQPSGGLTRFSYTAEERAAKERVAQYLREAGAVVWEDAVGNLYGRREGTRSDGPAVVIGSHLDTVPHGGRFDGALGVLAGVEVLQVLDENSIHTAYPVEVVAFVDEEGARFRFGLIGSRAVAGALTPEDLERRDAHGVMLGEAMNQAGYDPQRFLAARRRSETLRAYLELHIEQGPVLERRDVPVGVVSGIAGPLWLSCAFEGRAAHAGTVPMGDRQDALVAASAFVLAVEEEARRVPEVVATVGTMRVQPGGINVVPGRVELTVDLRAADEARRDEVERRIRERGEALARERSVSFSVSELQRIPPVGCDPLIRSQIEDACRSLGVPYVTLPSGAGHDAMLMARICPVGMIFVRSKGGVSHHPDEWSDPGDCGWGAQVLLETVFRLAEAER